MQRFIGLLKKSQKIQRLQLKSGSHIAVIGAGPAGSFFACFAKKNDE